MNHEDADNTPSSGRAESSRKTGSSGKAESSGETKPSEDPAAAEARKRLKLQMWLGIGVPSGLAGLIAVGLGVWWWVVAIFLFVVALGIVLNS